MIVYSGTMGTTHNIEDVINLSIKFNNKNSNLHFLFIGGGAKFDYVKNKIQNLDNCSVLPFQPYNLVSHVISCSLACVVCLDDQFTGISVPSKSYGILACGKPIIGFVSENSEIGKMIKENKLGVLVNKTKNLGEVCQEISQFLETIDAKKENEIINYFKQNHTLETIASSYLNLLKYK